MKDSEKCKCGCGEDMEEPTFDYEELTHIDEDVITEEKECECNEECACNHECHCEENKEYLKDMLRIQAEFDNYRKRQAAERESLLKYGASETLKKLLPVLDNIERARKSFETAEDKEMIVGGFEVIAKNLIDVLTKCGLEKIEAVDKEFDPNFHEAVSQTPTDEKPENTVVSELQAGYKMGDVVLRPTYVTVAVKPSEG